MEYLWVDMSIQLLYNIFIKNFKLTILFFFPGESFLPPGDHGSLGATLSLLDWMSLNPCQQVMKEGAQFMSRRGWRCACQYQFISCLIAIYIQTLSINENKNALTLFTTKLPVSWHIQITDAFTRDGSVSAVLHA